MIHTEYIRATCSDSANNFSFRVSKATWLHRVLHYYGNVYSTSVRSLHLCCPCRYTTCATQGHKQLLRKCCHGNATLWGAMAGQWFGWIKGAQIREKCASWWNELHWHLTEHKMQFHECLNYMPLKPHLPPIIGQDKQNPQLITGQGNKKYGLTSQVIANLICLQGSEGNKKYRINLTSDCKPHLPPIIGQDNKVHNYRSRNIRLITNLTCLHL